jgi:hypothetical protein
MGFPVCIEDPKYGRNAFIFNAGFVLSLPQPNSDHANDPTSAFGPVVSKLAGILRTVEVPCRAQPKLHTIDTSDL